MPMANQMEYTNKPKKRAAQVIQLTKLPSHLLSLMQPVSSKVSAATLRKSMIFLQSSLPSSALSLFSVRRVGRGYGISTACPFCLAKPPEDYPAHRTDLRRRWQAAHLADHLLKRDTPDKIDYHAMEQISKTVGAVAWDLANQPGRPKLKSKLPDDLLKDMKTVQSQGWGKITPVSAPLPGEPY